jgi:hypothetical protein
MSHHWESLVKASYAIVKIITTKSTPFRRVNLFGTCCRYIPREKRQFSKITLSPHLRITDLATWAGDALKSKASNFESYSLALDDSTDVSDTVKLLALDDSTDVSNTVKLL